MPDSACLWEIWTSEDGKLWEAVTDGTGGAAHQYSDWSTIQREADHWAAQFAFVQIRLTP